MGTELNVYSIDSGTQDYEFSMNWTSYLAAFILITLTILVFTATIKSYKA